MTVLPASARALPATLAADIALASHATPRQLQRRQQERLADLLRAAAGTRHYARWLHGRDPRSVALEELPPSSKAQLMHPFGDGVTDAQLTLEAVQAFAADAARAGAALLGRYWVWESSGSTGVPAWFVQDETAMAVYDALEAERHRAARPWVRWFDPLYLGERFAFVGAVDGHFASHVSLQRLRRRLGWAATNWASFSILQPTTALLRALEAFGPSIVATYPTAAALLADEARRGALHIRPQEVWTGGETLTAQVRAHVEQTFGCTVINSYGASEFLPIAWECAQQELHVNADWVILEPVDRHGRPVAPGEVSHTTLLTNLANHAQPLIRFDIGDRIAMPPGGCECGSALPRLQVQGRRDDALRLDDGHGGTVTLLPLALTTVLEEDAGAFDFQLCQHSPRSLELRLGPRVPATAQARQRCKAALLRFLQAQGASGARVSVRHLQRLPLGASGKLKRVLAADGQGAVPVTAGRSARHAPAPRE